MSLERLVVWTVVAVVAGATVFVTLEGGGRPPAPPEQLVLLLLAAIVVLPLAFVFARLLLAIPARGRGWRPR